MKNVSLATLNLQKFHRREHSVLAGLDKILGRATVVFALLSSINRIHIETKSFTGDSGGGFYYKVGNVWHIQGIVSATVIDGGRCDVSKYSVYTNVLKLVDWIKDAQRDQIDVAWNDINLDCRFVRNFE
jgi:secreted trypsin-like serine protease